MAKQKKPLTSNSVRTAKPGKHSDGTGTGLILKVSNKGSRSWIQRITVEGKTKDIGLGSFPNVSLAKARELARTNYGLMKEGIRPAYW